MASANKADIEQIIGQLSQKIDRLMTASRGLQFSQGLAAARPASPTVARGSTILYFATDSSVVSIWNSGSSAWVNLN